MPLISEFPIAGPQGKQGPIGPQGKQGPEGKRGPMGPAGPGTGDMLAMVYDPQGKAIDVYKYTDDAAAGRADLTLSNLSNRQKALRNIGGRPNRNLLDNWYFAGGGSQQGEGQLPINQRGQTSYTGPGIGIDRWSSDSQMSLTSDSLSVQGNLYQTKELSFMNQLLGKSVTVSALTTERKLIVGYVHLSDSYDSPIFIPTSSPYFSVYYNPSDNGQPFRLNGTYSIIAAKLELGSHQTLAYQDEDGNWQLFETPDYAEELTKCQRYQIVYPAQGTLIPLSGYNANSLWGCIFLPEEMRITPSIGGGTIGIYGAGENISVPVSGFSISLYLIGNILVMRADKVAHGLTPYTATMQLNNLILDANL